MFDSDMSVSKQFRKNDYISESLTKIDCKLFDQIKRVVIHKDSFGEEIFLITSSDNVYGFGRNYSGRLGFGNDFEVNEPKIIPELSGKIVIEIKCGQRISVALTESGVVYTYGFNILTGLVDIGNGEYLKPAQIKIDNQLVTSIECTAYVTHLLTQTAQLYNFGYFKCTENYIVTIPEKVSRRILSVRCGTDHVLALTNKEQVYSWGENSSGQLGLGHTNTITSPQLIQLENNIFIKQISCGSSHSLLLTTYGQIYSMGKQISGILCKPQLIDIKMKFKEICCFGDISMSIDFNDRINVWGSYLKRQINSPEITKFRSFQEVINELDNVCSLKPLEKSELLKKKPFDKPTQLMAKIFNNPEISNLKFKLNLRGSTDKYEYIYGHKCILEESSEYFKTMFASNWSENETNEIEITDYSYEAYYQYIRSLYTDYIETEDFELLLELLSITEKYLDSDKKDKCEEQIKSLTTLENVCTVFCCAVKYRSDYLKQLSFDMIRENKKEVAETADFKQMEPLYAKDFLA